MPAPWSITGCCSFVLCCLQWEAVQLIGKRYLSAGIHQQSRNSEASITWYEERSCRTAILSCVFGTSCKGSFVSQDSI